MVNFSGRMRGDWMWVGKEAWQEYSAEREVVSRPWCPSRKKAAVPWWCGAAAAASAGLLEQAAAKKAAFSFWAKLSAISLTKALGIEVPCIYTHTTSYNSVLMSRVRVRMPFSSLKYITPPPLYSLFIYFSVFLLTYNFFFTVLTLCMAWLVVAARSYKPQWICTHPQSDFSRHLRRHGDEMPKVQAIGTIVRQR